MLLAPLAAMVLVPVAAHAEEAAPPAEAKAQTQTARDYIPFANNGGVWDWRSEGDSVVYFQDPQKHWYKAELMAPAHDLPFVQYIGIDAGVGGRLDKFGGIYVHGQKYAFKSFQQIEGAPPKKAPKGG